MNEPQLEMSEQINNNSGNTLRRVKSNALIFTRLVFSFLEGHFKRLSREVCLLSQAGSPGTVGSS